MKLATFVYSISDTRADILQDIATYADIIMIPIEEANVAINIFGNKKLYIFLCDDYTYDTPIQDVNFILQASKDWSFFSFTDNPIMWAETATTWEQMNQCNTHAAILVDTPIVFSIEKLKKFRQSYQGLLIATNAGIYNNSIQSWFMRPEDIYQYEDVFDAIVVAPAYLSPFAKKDYNGPLNLLFPSLNINIENKILPNDFAEHRLNCEQKCQEPIPMCHYCERILSIASSMQKLSEGDIYGS